MSDSITLQLRGFTMSYRKLLVLAALAGIISSATACANVTGPTPTPKAAGFCQITSGGQTCDD